MAIRLIINADDFGYFSGVSAGILDAAEAGIVTATGVMANGPAFHESVPKLIAQGRADAGVHLNASYGRALSAGFPELPGVERGGLPDKGHLVMSLLRGRLTVGAVEAEWRAQIAKCLDAGLPVVFLNSHEHVHMFPMLYPVMTKLAQEFHVPFVRHTHPEWTVTRGLPALIRSVVMGGFARMHAAMPGTPRMLGLAPSGQLDMAYFERVLPGLQDGASYELMCHPGRSDALAASDPNLQHYHDWSGELACLLSSGFRALLDRLSIRLVRFSTLHS